MKYLCRLIVCLGVLYFCVAPAPAEESTPEFRCALIDEWTNLFSDSSIEKTTGFEGPLDTPRNSYPAVHVLVNGLNADAEMSFEATCDGEALSGQWYRLRHVPVDFNTGLKSWTEKMREDRNPHVVRRAPFRAFDAIEPVTSPVTVLGKVSVLRFEVPVPADATPGKRSFTLKLASGDTTRDLEFDLLVHKATVPALSEKSFAYTNWCNFNQIYRWHKVKPWSEEHWKLIEQYASLMARSRQSSILLHCHTFFDKDFNLLRERMRRVVEIFTDAGVHWIEGGHLGGRTDGEWEAETFDVHGGIRATTPEGNEQLAHLCAQLMEEIERNGWKDRWLQHIADEPTPVNSKDYRILVGMVRKYMPGLPIIDAVMDTDLAGSVDIWCPKLNVYQENREAFERQRKQGDRIWVYSCLEPGGNWMNRLIDMELLRPMLIGWACRSFGLDGFLHWGLNSYRKDPFKVGNQQHGEHGDRTRLPAGDTHVTYPGPDGPWSSLRLEAHRTGFEDLELLRQLDEDKAAEIIATIVRGFDDYTKDVGKYREARRALLTAVFG